MLTRQEQLEEFVRFAFRSFDANVRERARDLLAELSPLPAAPAPGKATLHPRDVQEYLGGGPLANPEADEAGNPLA